MPSAKKESTTKKVVKKVPKSKKVTKIKVDETQSTTKPKIVAKKKKIVKKTEKVSTKKLKESVKLSESDQFLKDFDWDSFEDGIETIEDKKILELEKLIEKNFVDTYDDNVI